MKKISFGIAVCVFGMGIAVDAYAVGAPAVKIEVPLVQPSADTWFGQPKAEIRILSKLESQAMVLTIPVGSSAQYKTLTITVKKCITRPPTLPADSTAFVQIVDSQLSTNSFAAWIFAEEPGASVFEHPLYSVSIVGCSGPLSKDPLVSSPSDTTVQPKQNPVDNQSEQQTSDQLEQSLENSLKTQ